jgi:hypothetical protein
MITTALVTYMVVKQLHGVLEGIEVTEQVSADATLPPPFTAGKRADGMGGAYTVTSVTRKDEQ